MIALDIVVEAESWHDLPGLADLLHRAAQAALAADDADPDEELSATLLLADDRHVQILNRTWRGQDKATNVLSFPSGAPEIAGEPYALGDIALAFETVSREAKEEDKTLEAHAAHLAVHGLLHLLGHDHQAADEADDMEATETRALLALGLPDPYRDTLPTTGLATGPAKDDRPRPRPE